MHFPIERFRSLDFDSRGKAIIAWQAAMLGKKFAVVYRKWGKPNTARATYNSALLAIRDVKYWAEKAKEKNRV